MVGSSLFALGSFPPYAVLVDPRVVGATFVIGSLFFTSAGYSQHVQVLNQGRPEGAPVRYWTWRPATADEWATLVQLAGTVLFNVNTVDAMITTLTTQQENRLVWAPDVFGSVAFLVASHLSWTSVCGRLWCVRTTDAAWWVALVNYAGSVLFMASALASFTLRTTGEVVDIAIVNAGTFGGAVCFFVGAYLLMPPARRPARAARTG